MIRLRSVSAISALILVIVRVAVVAQQRAGHNQTREDQEWKLTYEWLSSRPQSTYPLAGFVPDEGTAAVIGEAVARALYGQKSVDRERPFRCRLRSGVWTVMGTLNPPGALGGVSIIQVCKEDGRVLLAVHSE